MQLVTLSIDTAHPTARIILADGEAVVAFREWQNTPTVGTDLLIYIDEVLHEAGVDKKGLQRIAVHPGPGSYGLVRTGIGTATMLAQAIGAELVETQGETVDELVEHTRKASPVASIEAKYRG